MTDSTAAGSEVMVRVLPTPNPNALKFIMNRPVKTQGKATFSKPSEAEHVRLARDLFDVEGVRQLHFFENVVTVTFADDADADTDTLRLEAASVLRSRLPAHDPGFLMEDERRKADRSNLPPEIQQIEEILDSTVRTYLQGDGGDIEVVSLKNHVLEVRYQGACGTCPSSTSATMDAIQGILRDQFDPELEIVPVE